MLTIIEECENHRVGVSMLHHATFGGKYEAELADRLRSEGLAVLSLVALKDQDIVGHILFSKLSVEIEGREVKSVVLAPLAVRPDVQNGGIGSQLVTQGLARMRAAGYEAVLVLGQPRYYARFGFSPDHVRKLTAPFNGESFMALEFSENALGGRQGIVRYPATFHFG